MTTQTAAAPMIGFDDERLARASLTYLAEPSDTRLGALAETYGAAPTLAAIKSGRLPGPPACIMRLACWIGVSLSVPAEVENSWGVAPKTAVTSSVKPT